MGKTLAQLSARDVYIFRVTALALVKYSHLTVSEVEVITHLHRQRAPATAAEIHDAVLAASVRDIIDRKYSLTRRVPLR